MNQKTMDQAWQQLQAHIAGFVDQALKNDGQRIEYKPRFIAQRPELPCEHHRNEPATTTISDNFSQQGEGR